MVRNWTIKDVLEWTTRYFADKGIQEPRLEAEVLLAGVLGKDRVYLYAHYDIPLNQEERNGYKEFISRRVGREPVAYITGHREFMSLDFEVSRDVLIPRPETELLVETALELASHTRINRICDVGTGSGVIAVSIGHYLTGLDISATDISESALAIARGNADWHGVQVTFLRGDLLSPLQEELKFDLITANLPYVAPEKYAQLEPEVKDYEPMLALVAAGDGLDLYRRLAPQCLDLLAPGGYTLWEIDPEQTPYLPAIMTGFDKVEIIKDLAGRNRLVKARKG
ncbi:MAG: peptide chain release factor N(5)-glutamine methyltransferase [Syntrophomonas sp.]